MKKFLIPLATALIVAVLIFAGCAKPAPAPAPPPGPANPYEGLAIKPDGTPYKFGTTYLFLGCDPMVNFEGIMRSLLTRAGGEVTSFDANSSVEAQIGFIEDLIAAGKTDALLMHAVDEKMLAPVVDKASDAGIDVYPFDIAVYSDKIISFVFHDFNSHTGTPGSNVVGQFFVDKAEAENREIHIFECWGDRAYDSSIARHDGFRAPIDQCPLITVMESADTYWSPDTTASYVIDAFTAHPELGGLYTHGGEIAGGVEGLRTVGRLLPLDDPNHVVVCSNDTDPTIVEAMDDGFVDGIGSHGPWDLGDGSVKVALWHTCLGKTVPKEFPIPMFVITPANIDVPGSMYGNFVAYPRMPAGQWDLWPVLDMAELGLETPHK